MKYSTPRLLSLFIVVLFTPHFPLLAQKATPLENTKAIIKTIINRDEDGALKLLNQGIMIDGDTPDTNPLINAIFNNMPRLIVALLENGASVKTQNADGYNPLMAAAVMADTTSVKLLLDYHADPFAKSTRGYNSFDLAIYSGKYFATEHLLLNYLKRDKGISERELELLAKEAKLKKGPAIFKKYNEEVAFLALAGNNVDRYLFMVSAHDQVTGVAKYPTMAALDICIAQGYFEFAERLLKNGAQVTQRNKHGKLPIEYMRSSRNKKLYLSIMRKMLAEKADSKCERKIVKKLQTTKVKVRKRAKLSPDFEQLLMAYAITKVDFNLVRQMLKKGVNPNGQSQAGIYYLSSAVQNNSMSIVQLLLEKGANIQVQNANTYQTTAFIEAASTGDVKMGQYLLNQGARLNFGDINNDHALNYAVYYGHTDFVKFLLEKGADFHRKGQGGYTALMTAKANNHTDIVKLLVEKYGATE